MKLLEKLKNTFFEEEYVEVEEPKREEVAKKVEVKEIKREERPVKKMVSEEEVKPEVSEVKINDNNTKPKQDNFYSDRDLVKKSSKVPYFEDEDFIADKPKKTTAVIKETKKVYGQSPDKLYESIKVDTTSNKPYSATSKGKFQPTPIISPIYGVLDKNYHKEEVIDKKDRPSSYVSRKNADLDSIRKKAYGDVSIFDSSIKEEEKIEDNEPLLYDMIDEEDTKPVVDQVTMADAEEYFNDLGLEYNVDYKDGKHEAASGRKINSRLDRDKNLDQDFDDGQPLEENLFDLVDSMYEGGEE